MVAATLVAVLSTYAVLTLMVETLSAAQQTSREKDGKVLGEPLPTFLTQSTSRAAYEEPPTHRTRLHSWPLWIELLRLLTSHSAALL